MALTAGPATAVQPAPGSTEREDAGAEGRMKMKTLRFRHAIWMAAGVVAAQLLVSWWQRVDPAIAVWIGDAVAVVSSALATAGLLWAARTSRETARRRYYAWLFLAAGQAAYCLGQLIWAVLELVLDLQPFPSLADPLYLLFYPLFVTGLVLFPADHVPRLERRKILLDVGIVITAAFLLFWTFLIAPAIAVGHPTQATLALSIAYPVLDLVLLVAVTILIFRRVHSAREMPLLLLAAGVAAQIVADAGFSVQSLRDSYANGGWVDLAWVMASLSVFLAGSLEAERRLCSFRRHPTVGARGYGEFGWRAYLTYAWAVAACSLLVWGTGHPLPLPAWGLACAVGAVLGLTITRQLIALRENTALYRAAEHELIRREEAEHELRAQRDRAQQLLDIVGSMIVVLGTDQKVTRANRKCAEVLQCKEEDILGCNWFDRFVPERDREATRTAFHRLIAGEEKPVEYFENTVMAGNGEARVIAWHNALLHDDAGRIVGTLSSGNDITDRLRAEEEIRTFQFMVDGAVEEIYLVSPDGELMYVNQAAASSLGYTVEEMMRLGLKGFDPVFGANYRAHFEELKRTSRPAFETWHTAKDGRRVLKEIKSCYLRIADREYVCGFGRDVTDRKRAEEERRRFEEQVQQAQKLESLGVLTGGIAHDFNNILMAILGNANLALAEISPASPALTSLKEIEHAARRAADLCRQMLAYSGKGQFTIEPLCLSDLVQEMAQMLEISISKKAIIRYHFTPNLPPVMADATQLRQVVMNLIINASEAIGDKSGVIAINTGIVECDRAYLRNTYLDENLAEGAYVTLEVSDTGCGMDKATQARIFDPFFTTKFTGRGLGLAAVLGIIRAHRGAIKVYSEPGRGSTFKMLLPAAEEAAVSGQDAGARSPSAWRGSGTILVVDDEESVRVLAKRMVEKLGFSAVSLADGRDAVAALRARPAGFACVILDLTMPHLDGAETFRELRRVQPDVRVIMSSGYTEQEVTQRFAGKGLAGFIQKPYTLDVLAETLRAVVGTPHGG